MQPRPIRQHSFQESKATEEHRGALLTSRAVAQHTLALSICNIITTDLVIVENCCLAPASTRSTPLPGSLRNPTAAAAAAAAAVASARSRAALGSLGRRIHRGHAQRIAPEQGQLQEKEQEQG